VKEDDFSFTDLPEPFEPFNEDIPASENRAYTSFQIPDWILSSPLTSVYNDSLDFALPNLPSEGEMLRHLLPP
jgi:hypothetical protein